MRRGWQLSPLFASNLEGRGGRREGKGGEGGSMNPSYLEMKKKKEGEERDFHPPPGIETPAEGLSFPTGFLKM